MSVRPDSSLRQQAEALIQEARFAEAATLLTPAVEQAEAPAEQADLRYLLAVAQRYGGNAAAALSTIDALLSGQPQRARAHQERGHICQVLGDQLAAERSYERAVQLNPSLIASWKGLVALYDRHDLTLDPNLARRQREAVAQIAALAALPPELQAAQSLLFEERYDRADEICRQFLTRHKTHPEGMRLLAQIALKLGILADAEFVLESLLALHPAFQAGRYDYANLLLRMQKFEPAAAETRRLLASQPGHLPYLALHANAIAGIGDAAHAVDLYNQVLERSPRQPQLLVMRGHTEKAMGQLPAAVASYQAALALQPDYGDAYWSLANTKSYHFSAAEVAAMRSAEQAPATQDEHRIHLCFALGKALEDRQDFAASFNYYERGNTLQQTQIQHRPEYLARRRVAQQNFFTAERFETFGETGHDDPAPIFVVGLPRAGSTLIEQILASHSQVDGTLELPHIIALVQRLRRADREMRRADREMRRADREMRRAEDRPQGADDDSTSGYPSMLATLDPEYLRRFGAQFIEQTQAYRQGARFFVDKNPNNFFHVGLIRLILPRARIIDARRHPLSCCFSNFKQLFGQGQEFTYGLREIGNYYREYVTLMEHWDSVLPGFVLRVQHEALVEDLETEVRRMLDFCNLPFESQCLQFHRTERNVRTPSSEQVRQPIYRSGLDAWKPFSQWLDPLREALGPDLRAQYGVDEPARS